MNHHEISKKVTKEPQFLAFSENIEYLRNKNHELTDMEEMAETLIILHRILVYNSIFYNYLPILHPILIINTLCLIYLAPNLHLSYTFLLIFGILFASL